MRVIHYITPYANAFGPMLWDSFAVRIRARHNALADPWMDYLFLSRPELEELAESGGWRVKPMIGDGPICAAVLAQVFGCFGFRS